MRRASGCWCRDDGPLRLLLLVSLLATSRAAQMVFEGSGTTTDSPTTTPAQADTNFKYAWGVENGDKEQSIQTSYRDVKEVFVLGSSVPFVINDIEYTKLVVSSNGLFLDTFWWTGTPGCNGYTDNAQTFRPSLVLAGLWTPFTQGPSTTSNMYTRITSFQDYRNDNMKYKRDFDDIVGNGLATNRKDIVWMIVNTILQDNDIAQNYVQTVLVALSDYTFKLSVEYKSVNLPDAANLFVGFCQSTLMRRLSLSDILPTSTSESAPHSFVSILPNSVSTTENTAKKQKFIKSARCLIWISKEQVLTFNSVPACPCTFPQALNSPEVSDYFYSQATNQVCAHVRTQLWDSTCCYVEDESFSLSRTGSFAAKADSDLEIRTLCQDVGLLNLYNTVRPNPSCVNFIACTAGSTFGDPHFQTLDGLDYTCNAVGYYRFFVIGETVCDIKLEGIQLGSVLTGISCKDVGSAIITFDLDATGEFSIRVKAGTSPSVLITDALLDENKSYRSGGVYLLKDNKAAETYYVKFEGKTIALSVAVVRVPGLKAILRQVLTVNAAVKTRVPTSLGLLGAFNGDNTDDMQTPDGQVIPSDSSERSIYLEFCKKWEVNIAGRPMIYEEPSGVSKMTRASFEPSFCDEVQSTPEVLAACAGNLACQCDASVTGSTAFASATLSASTEIETLKNALANSPPTALGAERIEATLNTAFTTTYSGEDPDNHTVTLSASSKPAGSSLTTAGVFTWTPTSIDKTERLVIVPTDETNLAGPSLSVTLVVCNCMGHGDCIFNELQDDSSVNDLYQVVKCSCKDGWIGNYCGEDVDSCCETCGHTCKDVASCTDLNPDEVAMLDRPFNCTACVDGYSIQDGLCSDVNECTAGTPCQANTDCNNNEGSYTCPCKSGYRLNVTICENIDECAAKTDNCNQTCTDNDGSFTCSCYDGYDLTNEVCVQTPSDAAKCASANCDATTTICSVDPATEMPECVCIKGYENDASSNTTCTPTNECTSATDPHACVSPASCSDLPLGYTCTCPDGMLLTPDERQCKNCSTGTWGKDCVGVCSCKTGTDCNLQTGCSSCEPGKTGSSCELDVNECTATPLICGNNSTCNNTDGSYVCTCDQMFQRNVTSFSCDPINMCLDNPCALTGTCVQKEVTYECICESGFGGQTCNEDMDVCSTTQEPCKNGGTCIEGRGLSYTCNCTSDFIGTYCDQQAPVPTTTTVTPSNEFSGSIKLDNANIPAMNTEAYNLYVANLTKALKDAIQEKLGVVVEVQIDRINNDGQVFFTIVSPQDSSLMASDFGTAIVQATAGGTLSSGSMTFNVTPGSVQIGGPGTSSATPTTKANTVLPAVLGAVLGAAFLALATVLIAFISKRLARRAALTSASKAMYGTQPGYGRGVPGRLRWLPRFGVSGHALSQVRPRMRPQNMPWAVDPFEPEVDPTDVSWKQWRGGDNSYYNRGPVGGRPGPMMPRPMRQPNIPLRTGPNALMFRSPGGGPGGLPPTLPGIGPPMGAGLPRMRPRMPAFLRRTLRAIPAFLQRSQPVYGGPMQPPAPHPGLPYVGPSPMMLDYETLPPPMRLRMSSRADMPGSGMGQGAFAAPSGGQFSWGATNY